MQQQGFGAYPPPGAPPQGFSPAMQQYAQPYGAQGQGFPQQGGMIVEQPRETPAKMLRGFLVAYQLNAHGDFWPLTGGRHVVGRAGAGDGIDIPIADPTISSKHAALTVDAAAGAISIEDTGSTNGTFVNDEHLGFNGRRELRDGDRIRFGGFNALVKIISRI
jgi:pSer/pThr/pTyr-binding forkhead associated (FHA) protein